MGGGRSPQGGTLREEPSGTLAAAIDSVAYRWPSKPGQGKGG